MIRKIQTGVSQRRSSSGLEKSRERYISRALKDNNLQELKYANSRKFKTAYNQKVRKNIINKTNSTINQIIKSQDIGSENRKLLREVLENGKSGTKKLLKSVQKAKKNIKKFGLKKFVNRKKFVRQLDPIIRNDFSAGGLLNLKNRSEYYFSHRDLILKFNEDRDNKKLERKIKQTYKVHKSDETTAFMDEVLELL